MAIAFDSAVNAARQNGVASLTFSFNNVAGNLVAVSAWTTDTAGAVTATYNGTAMTEVGAGVTNPDTLTRLHVFVLKSPATGAHNVVVTLAGSFDVTAQAVSYSGTDTTTQPDASNSGTGIGTADFSLAVTTVTDNAWTVFCPVNNGYGVGGAAGTGSTQRLAPTDGLATYDSNAVISPAGSNTMHSTTAGVSQWAGIIFAIRPSGAVATTRRLMTLGVG